MEPQDTITIAPSVLITVVQRAATQVKGISRMGSIPVNIGRLLQGRPMASGVVLDIVGNTIRIDLYVVVKPEVSIRTVGHEAQKSITRSIQELVGMDVSAVNLHVEDVDFSFL